MAAFPCPACDERLANGQPVVFVFVGTCPEYRKPAGWTTGAAVVVHKACAGNGAPVAGSPEAQESDSV